jgi:twitching motility protein PilT
MSEPIASEETLAAGTLSEGSPKKPRLHTFLKTVGAVNGSDLHLKADVVPRVRVGGDLKTLKTEPLSNDEIDVMVREILSPAQLDEYNARGSIDIAYAMSRTERFRVNIFRQRGYTSLAARRINPRVPSYAELHLPDVLNKVATVEQGLILLCGITGSGKSTTIAAMIEQINESRSVHIVTVEDPIEYAYVDKKAFINQREVGLDCESYDLAVRSLMREDPDVIVIGEMRDRTTFTAAIQAAETGHLVFSTIHASSAPGAITRILELFPQDQHGQIRTAIATNLQAIIYQKLIPAIDPNVKRVPCIEVMLQSPNVRKYISESRESELTSVIRNERGTGMIDFNDMLAELVLTETVSNKEALLASPNPDELRMRMKGIKTSV